MKKALLLILSIVLISSLGNVNAQSNKNRKFEMDLGLGFPDLLHVGMKYKFTRLSTIGMSYGTVLAANRNRKTSAVTLEHAYHFGKLNEHSKLPMFYASQKLTYLNDIKQDVTANIFYFTPSVGKSFYGGGPFGINIDIGMNFRLYQTQETDLFSDAVRSEPFPAIFPAIRFQFFFNM